jgi:hypothetical protein
MRKAALARSPTLPMIPSKPTEQSDRDIDLEPLEEWPPELDPDDPAILGTPPGTSREQSARCLYGDRTLRRL